MELMAAGHTKNIMLMELMAAGQERLMEFSDPPPEDDLNELNDLYGMVPHQVSHHK